MEACSGCDFELWNPVSTLKNSFVSLYDDARYEGRCIVALNVHTENIEDLDPELSQGFMMDVYLVARAIKAVTHVERVNIAILGNTVPHIHAHVIPRYPNTELTPHKSIWNDVREKTVRDKEVKDQLISKLHHELNHQKKGRT